MKKLVTLLLALVILCVAAALAAPYLISADSIKNMVVQKVKDATGRTLTIGGDLQLSFFPAVGVVAQQVSLSNDPKSGDKNAMLSADTLRVSVEVMPLLERTIVVKSFSLDNAKILLHVAKDGTKNWEFASAKKSAEPASAASGSPSPLLALPANIRFSDVTLKNGFVSYVDDSQNTHQEISNINASIALDGLSSPLQVDASADWTGKTVKIKGEVATLQALLNNSDAKIDLSISSDVFGFALNGVYKDAVFAGKTNVSSPSLKALLSWLNPKEKPVPTPAALALNASGDASCETTYCNFKTLNLTLDKIHASGSAKVAMKDDNPNVDLKLDVDALDFNPFMAAEKHAALPAFLISGAIAQSAGHWSAAPIDLSALKAVTLTSQITTGSITYGAISIGKSSLNAKILNGKLDADITSPEFYSGKGSVSLVVDATSGAISTRANLTDVQVAPLLKDAMQMDRITGKANLDVNVNGQGRSQQAIVSSLAGNGKIDVKDGTIQRVDILNMLNNVQSAFAGANSGSKNTAFSEMGGSFTIANGVINNQDLSLKMQAMNVSGKGTIDLPAYRINYRLTPQTMGKGQGGTAQAGLGVPVLITGSLDNPSFQPDIGSVIQNAIKDPAQLREQLKNNERAIKEGLKNPNDAVKNLKGLFKGLQGN